jgi:hypothetical protein
LYDQPGSSSQGGQPLKNASVPIDAYKKALVHELYHLVCSPVDNDALSVVRGLFVIDQESLEYACLSKVLDANCPVFARLTIQDKAMLVPMRATSSGCE